MANIREKAISILVGNLNLGRSYFITTVMEGKMKKYEIYREIVVILKDLYST